MTKAKNQLLNDKATREWLDSQKKGTRSTYQTAWKYFLEYVGMTGDQILESRKDDKDYAWEKRVLEFKRWMIEEKGQSENTAKTGTTTARSFFAFHRTPLEFRKTEKAKLKEARPKSEDYRFSVEDLKKMSDVADLTERYVITAGKSFGLRAGDFLRRTRGDLEAYIDRETPISIGEINTQKENVKAYPFIDADAQPVIKLMLDTMNREGKIKPSDRMLAFKDEIQLTRVLKRVAEKAGINVGNKNVRFHCMRKFLIDHLSSYMSESKWKQIVGKTISEGAYVSPETLREDYARAMTETCFTKRISEDVEKIAKREALIAIAKNMGMTDAELKSTFRMRKPKHIGEEIETLEKLIEEKRNENSQKTETNGGCVDGEHCGNFRQIGETELLSYLKQGWQIVHNLQNGEVIVKL